MNELMNKFRRLLGLCPEAVANEKDKVRLLVKALRPNIAVHVYQGDKLPATIEKCFCIALQREYHLNENDDAAKKKEVQPAQPQNTHQNQGEN